MFNPAGDDPGKDLRFREIKLPPPGRFARAQSLAIETSVDFDFGDDGTKNDILDGATELLTGIDQLKIENSLDFAVDRRIKAKTGY